MSNKISGLFRLTALCLLPAVFASCSNDPANIGLDTMPKSDMIHANSVSKDFYAKNIIPDRVITDSHSNGATAILGYFSDPIFGPAKADFVSEFSLSKAGIDPFFYDPDTKTPAQEKMFPDSVILHLPYFYQDWFGKLDAKQKLHVYELSERLEKASSNTRYYNDYEIMGKYYANLLAEKEYTVHGGVGDTLTDSTWNTLQGLYTMKIKLADEVADKLFNLTSEQLSSDELFKEAFNGLYITTPSNPSSAGSLLLFNLYNRDAKLVLHYHKQITNDSIKKYEYNFPIDHSSRFFNMYSHSFSSSIVTGTTDASMLMIQGLAGSYAEFDISSLVYEWKDSLENNSGDLQIGISGVDLTFIADTLTKVNGLFTPASNVLQIKMKDSRGIMKTPTYIDSDGDEVAMFITSAAAFDVSTLTYTFKLNQAFFEDAALGKVEVPILYLQLPSAQFNFNRVVLFNNVASGNPVFRVKYVKYRRLD